MKLDKITELGKDAGGSISNLPNEFTGNVLATKTEIDKYETTCLIATIEVDGITYNVSYKPLHAKALAEALKEINVDEFKGRFNFKKKEFGIGFARPIPYEQLM